MSDEKKRERWKSEVGESFSPEDLVRMVSRRTGFTNADVQVVIRATFDIIEEILCSGNSVNLGHIKFGNTLKRLAPFYSKIFDAQIPARYSLKPKVFFTQSIIKQFKKYTDQLEINKEWIMLKSTLKRVDYKNKEKGDKDDE